jgi:NAD(P)-dependent dehydrogenase (short-subunit alcohol dehydrogenase family)
MSSDSLSSRSVLAANALQGRCALVLGASRGIGAATARVLASAGARVVLASRDVAALESVAQEIAKAGGEAYVEAADMLVPAQVTAAVAHTVRTLGRLDIAVNNAGVNARHVPMAELPDEEFDRILNINLRSVFIAMKHEIKAMLPHRAGVIVNTASIGSVVALPRMAAYTASKHGLIGLTKAAAADYAKEGIRINAVAPGTVMTKLLRDGAASTPEGEARLKAVTPMGRIGEPEEIAGAIAWLCSDAASYITGATLMIDGGYTVL